MLVRSATADSNLPSLSIISTPPPPERAQSTHTERENARARVGVDANGTGGTQTAQQANTGKNACGELLANCDGGVKTAR